MLSKMKEGTRLHPRVPPFLIHRMKGCAERGLLGPSYVGPRLSFWTSVPSCFPTLTKPLGPGLPGEASTPPGHCPSHRPSLRCRGWSGHCALRSMYICIKEWDFNGAYPTLSLCDSLVSLLAPHFGHYLFHSLFGSHLMPLVPLSGSCL